MAKDIIWVLSIVTGLLVGYLGGYVKKKAENRAMREDIEVLTRAAEEIKANVADKSWDRQRHWEMKRDALLAMIQALGLAGESLMYMAGTYQIGRAGQTPPDWPEKAKELSETWLQNMNDYDQKRFVASLLGGKDLDEAMQTAGRSMRKLAQAAMKGLPYDMDTDMPNVREKIAAVRIAATKALSLERAE